jgi:hypothetical protein
VIERRALLRGLFAMPAVVAVESLMPIRGIISPVDYNIPIRGLLTPVDYKRRQRIAAAIRGLKADGIWDKIDRLWLLDADTEEEALTDIRNSEEA